MNETPKNPEKTLLDEFAMAALQGFASHPGYTMASEGEPEFGVYKAKTLYMMANAMLKAREAQK